jgi:hypothetical protein
MGSADSKAEEQATEAQKEINQMLQVLKNKMDEFLATVKLTGGEGTENHQSI